ncbi:MAG: hypothetical protein EOP04_00080 [Proteobacteria bacterium]|nr:MAG: hypothetical protein EOP04_00080 [Pseudomonadota bacterium]
MNRTKQRKAQACGVSLGRDQNQSFSIAVTKRLGFKLAGWLLGARKAALLGSRKVGKKASAKTALLLLSKAVSLFRRLYAVKNDVGVRDAVVLLEARQRRSTLIFEEAGRKIQSFSLLRFDHFNHINKCRRNYSKDGIGLVDVRKILQFCSVSRVI